MVDTNKLVPCAMVTNLHMNEPSAQWLVISRYRLRGCVNTHSVRSEMARLMMKMLRGVSMDGLRTTCEQTVIYRGQ